MMKVISCSCEKHAEAIRAIFNEAILHTTALYDYQPRTPEMMERWFEAKAAGNYPVLGVENAGGELMGFASYGPFRERPAYKYSIEHSIYVDRRFRGQGVGKRLLQEVITAATGQDYHMLIGGIDASNIISIRLHEQFGFTRCGTILQAGFKFGRWLDLVFYQRILPTPHHPVDG